MKKLLALVLSVALVLSLVIVNTVSAAGTFCADTFAIVDDTGSNIIKEYGANKDLGQVHAQVVAGGTYFHARGWYLPQTAMTDIGVQVDNNDVEWGKAFVDAAIYGPLNSELPLRYEFTIPILEGSHTIKVVARLTSGEDEVAFETKYLNDDTVVADWVNTGTGAGIGLWLKEVGSYAAAAFTATDSFSALRIPINWSSRIDKDQPITYEMALYRYYNNIENSLTKTPIARMEYAPEGDHSAGDVFEFAEQGKGQYVYAIRILTVENGGYLVLPIDGNTDLAAYASTTGQTFNFGIKSYVPATIFGDVPEETDTPDPTTVVNYSYDTFKVNDVINFGQGDGGAEAKLDAQGRVIDGSDGSVNTLTIRGWIGFVEEMESFGYKINDGEPVFGDFKAATEPGVLGAGGYLASRFEVVVPVSELKGENDIVAVVKLISGDVVVFNGENGAPKTQLTYIGASEAETNPPETTQPETTPSEDTRDFSSDSGDHLSYDQILVNGNQIANGNDAVIENKQLIDGSDGSVQTISMHGWYGNDNAKIAAYGYRIDGGEPVFGNWAIDAEPQVIEAGGESRYTITVDVSGLKDGATHKIEAVVQLENGDIVVMNRNDNGTKDREVFVNYKAFLEETPVEPHTQTGDAAIAMIAVIAVLAMGAAVVFAKKRSF